MLRVKIATTQAIHFGTSHSFLDTCGWVISVRKLNLTKQARSSVEEHYLDTVGVGSSILPVPTSLSAGSRASLRARRNLEARLQANLGAMLVHPLPNPYMLDLNMPMHGIPLSKK